MRRIVVIKRINETTTMAKLLSKSYRASISFIDASYSPFPGRIRPGIPTTKESGGTSLVTTVPAPVLDFAPTFTGAIKTEFTPINDSSPITV